MTACSIPIGMTCEVRHDVKEFGIQVALQDWVVDVNWRSHGYEIRWTTVELGNILYFYN
jgi:hypothetical protein